MKKIGIILILLAAISGLIVLLLSQQRTKTTGAQQNNEISQIVNATPTTNVTAADAPVQTVTLTADGFSPKEVTIKQGDTISFTSSSGQYFWPASDPHPSHYLYPEFDPKVPIAPTASWNFRFDKVGTWRYHDHLNPLFSGTITVTPK